MQKKHLLILLMALALGCTQQQKFGPYGSAHEHADFKVYILGTAFNFSDEKYQTPVLPGAGESCYNESTLVHLHNGDGELVHKHASGVTWGYFFSTLDITLSDNCFAFDNGTRYCNDAQNRWRFFINGQEVPSLVNSEIRDLGRVLLTYGSNEGEIRKQLASVSSKASQEKDAGFCAVNAS